MSAPWTIEQYQTLVKMIAKGVTSLEVNGEKVTYRSLNEMMRIKAMMERDLGLVAVPRQQYPAFRKG
ncbi:phage head-tail joining protein [Paracoccus alkenifer]|uniref:GpW protein n=1 Tax=Paracoccus alkenifer TaxID=65735 RepID=A0A1H6NDU2_9RHOB|nr:hypothetical protein [Paracoccus alkenifer]SEI10038.1 hypothetical protein SAMN04488075_2862 [Paracoccus alkenifer]